MKKSTSVVLAILLSFALVLPSFGADKYKDNDDEEVILPEITRIEIDSATKADEDKIIVGAYVERYQDPAFWIDAVFVSESQKSIHVRLLRNGIEDCDYDFSGVISGSSLVKSATYTLSKAVVGDNDGHRATYTKTGHSFESGDWHVLPNTPSLKKSTTSTKMAPTSINVTQKGFTYNVTVNAKGGTGAVDSVTLLFENPVNHHRIIYTLGEDELIAKNSFSGTLPVSKFEPEGNFKLKQIILKDKANNKATFSNDEDEEEHFPLRLTAEFNTAPAQVDNTPPWVSSIKTIRQTKTHNGETTETVLELTAGDKVSGIHHVTAKFTDSKTGQSLTYVFTENDLTGKNVYRGTLKADTEDKAGSYRLEKLTAVDNAGNRQIYNNPADIKDEQKLLPQTPGFVVA